MKTALPVSNHSVLMKSLVIAALGLLGINLAVAQPSPVVLDGFEVHPTRILAKYKSDNQTASAGVLSAMESRVYRRYQITPRWVVLEDTGNAASADDNSRRSRLQNRIAALKNSDLFEYVEPDYIVKMDATPTDQAFVSGTLWGLRNYGQFAGLAGADISATNAWDINTGSTNIIVAVIDTGVRYTHLDLAAQMWRNPGETPGNGVDDDGNGYIDDVHGINAINGTGNPMDDDDHGTHVAGTIGAAANDGNPHVGVAWKVRVMACKFLGVGGGTTSDGIECVNYAVSKGAHILNNSWGGGGYSQALFDAIDNAREAGVLFVAAAGNDGLNNDLIPHYPANYPVDNVISVAALDRNDQLADFSDYGAVTVHLGAPGVAIYSSAAGSDSSYITIDGTSMATPHVSGAAALIRSQFPGADLAELKARLLMGTVAIPSLAGKCTTGGRLNVYRSMTLAGSGVLQLSITPPSTSALLTSSTQPIFVRVTDLFGVQNATVVGSVTGAVTANLTFLDNGAAPDVLAGDAIYSANFSVPASTGSVSMTIIASATNKVSATNTVGYVILPPPPNDYFTNSIKVAADGGVFFANNRFATKEAGEPNHAGTNAVGSLWWSWTPSVTTNCFVDTTGSSIDTVVAVYTGNSVNALQLRVATNNIGLNRQAYVTFSATNGATYRIAVASVNTNSLGSIQLRVVPGGQPDTTAPVVAITSPLSGLTVTSNLLAISGTAADSVPNETGVSEVRLSINGAISFTASGTTNWSGLALLEPGINTIAARSYDPANNASAPATIQVNYFVNNPINDFFVNAISLNSNSGVDNSVYTTNATKEVNEPFHAGNAGGKSAWWRFQAPADGVLRVSTTNSGFDTVLGVYTGSLVGSLTAIAQNDDAAPGVPGGISYLTAPVRSNVVYSIAVDGYDGVAGNVSLQYAFTPAPLVHLTVNAGIGGTTSPGSTDAVSNSVVTVSAIPGAGYTFDMWDGDIVSVNSVISVQMTGDRSITAHFRPAAFTDGFESGGLTGLGWTTGGNLPWIVQTNSVAAGTFAARSGAINNSQTSSLLLTGNFRAGVGSFSYRVSSETTWDVFSFYLDGVLQQQWSGLGSWSPYSFPVTAGAHSLEWRYAKDSDLAVGLDAAFIDNVNLPVVVPANASTPAHLTAHRQTDGVTFLDLTGQTNQLYWVQFSTNLVAWQTFSTNVLVNGFAHVSDPGSVSSPVRFYRAVSPAP
jgi:subtilisin family serine protease